ncbi:hypothetical protein [Mycobacteroides abscessus]|uniref:hypothetical protein n=1 Tax=Mycobacteroides abscessus TaxID=36809 RepID=UPI00092B8D13|nr:hypothetical protein [Mycobacteroides abscessus]MDO2989262.1 hypothetical protein [Mycobacteroides abscessus subsp. massiliense]SHU98871.1 Uncharacterised protein [Mycobacteroides abscessus subsp. abscessus]SHV35270.1 Uncharacterised protein [Mycobacteroides abscessus subsp. abscessus]SII27902.1 Uncharacterised protein [Mycobacteroides abscessus subsp. abscessus]SKP43545.1 Uncharacterised protein [Mycobacteroides abscessus subsp. abscessus]
MKGTPAIRILSLGAGVQSTVLALMACDGTLPGLDAAVFADTGWEPPAVYEQVDRLAAELARVDIPLYRVSSGNLRADTLDPEARFVSVPWFALAPKATEVPVYGVCAPCGGSGRGPSDEPDSCSVCGGDGRGSIVGTRLATATERHGMGRRQCTSEYKLKPIKVKVRELLGYPHPTPVPRDVFAEQWIGFSTDEIHRVRDRLDVNYSRPRYPLLDLGMSRKDCQRWLERAGWGHTAKSACIGCPFHGNAQWRALRDTCECGHHRDAHNVDGWCEYRLPPDADYSDVHRCECPRFRAPQWADAVDFDRRIRKGGASASPLDGEAFLHRSRVPLDLAPIDRVTRAEYADMQLDLFEDGDPDGCSPYGCRSGEVVA